MIGILGDPDSGKTACLVSLYLMVANSSLSRWNFSESKSLMGFEDIARAAREWNRGTPPDQMTLRTELSDDRQPGFLHLRLCERESGRKVDFALPDLPGEWTTSLIGQGRTDRFSFLSAVDVLWLVVDGRKLSNRESKQGALNRMGQLAARLKNMLPSTPRVIVVATHHDTSPISSTDKEKLVKEFEKRSIGIEIVSVSPFSVSARVRAGYGLEELLEASLELPADTDSASDSSTRPRVSREFLKYRRQA